MLHIRGLRVRGDGSGCVTSTPHVVSGNGHRSSAWRVAAAVALGGLAVAGLADAASTIGPGETTTPATRTRTSWPRQLRVVAAGDIMPESPVQAAAADAAPDPEVRFDFAPLFRTDGIMGWADLAICHIEIPLGRAGGPHGYAGRSPFGGNLISGPYEIATGVAAASFDRCSTASNHAFDLGVNGVVSTLDALDAHGISHSGTARSENEGRPDVFDVADVRVAHLSYTRYSNTVLPADDWTLAYARTSQEIVDDVATVRAAGAEVVIVSIHLSWELQTAPTSWDRAFTTELVERADIDLVIHHGPHVVQPLEWVHGVPVFWSLGNFISGTGVAGAGRYEDPRTIDGLLVSVTFSEQPDGSFTADAAAVAICTDPVTRHVRHASAAMGDLELSAAERARAADCLARTRQVVPDAR